MATRAKEIRELGNTGYLEVDSSGNVGIGTDSPGYLLDVYGNPGSSAGSLLRLNSSITDDNGIIHQQADGTQWFTGQETANPNDYEFWNYNGSTWSNILHLDTNGNVGIGTASPATTLDTGYTRVYNSGAASSPSAGKGLEVHYVTSGRTQGEGAYLISYDRDNSAYKQFAVDANNIELATSGTTKLSILSNGNVGIGTIQPTAILDVRSGATGRPTFVHASGYGGLQLAGTGAGSGASLIFSNDFNNTVTPEFSIFHDGSNDNLVFISGDPADVATQEKMRLSDNGLQIRSNSYNILSVQTDFDDNGTSDDGIIKITNGSSNTTKAEFRWDESEDLVHVSYGDHGRHISIDSGGQVGIGTGSTAPGAPLDIQTPGSTVDGTYYSTVTINNTGTNTWSRLRFDRNGSARWGLALGTDDKFKISNLNVNGGGTADDGTLVISNNNDITTTGTFRSEKGTIQTVTATPNTQASGNPVNVWSEINSNYRVQITKKYADTRILGTYHIPMNPTGATNILMAIAPWYSTNGGTTKNIISQGIGNGSRHNLAVSWFRSNNGFDLNDMQNHVVHFHLDGIGAGVNALFGWYFRSEGGNTTYFCHSQGNNGTWGWVAPMYLELREVDL